MCGLDEDKLGLYTKKLLLRGEGCFLENIVLSVKLVFGLLVLSMMRKLLRSLSPYIWCPGKGEERRKEGGIRSDFVLEGMLGKGIFFESIRFIVERPGKESLVLGIKRLRAEENL